MAADEQRANMAARATERAAARAENEHRAGLAAAAPIPAENIPENDFLVCPIGTFDEGTPICADGSRDMRYQENFGKNKYRRE